MSQNRDIIGNTSVFGKVSVVDGNRLVIGTGSYTTREGEKVFKSSITVFMNDKFTGEKPAKGDWVNVSGDLQVSEWNGQTQFTFNVRFANQLVKIDPPKHVVEAQAKADEGASATAADADDDI